MDISYDDVKIKQYWKLTYLGCVLDECKQGNLWQCRFAQKLPQSLCLYTDTNRFLSKDSRRLLCSAFIQPHSVYAYMTWYENLNKKYRNKLQVLQNKCIHICLQLNNGQHIGTEQFEKINWLPIDQRFTQCLSTSVFKFFSENVSSIYEQNLQKIHSKQYCY